MAKVCTCFGEGTVVVSTRVVYYQGELTRRGNCGVESFVTADWCGKLIRDSSIMILDW